MENKQTAVEFLIEHIKLDAMYEAKSIDEWVNIFKQAKSMEKEQIMKANDDGFYECMHSGFQSEPMTAEQYYKETYGAR